MYIASTNLGGKIDPSGPVPPKPGVSGRRAVGLNRNPVTVAWSMFWDEMGFCTFWDEMGSCSLYFWGII